MLLVVFNIFHIQNFFVRFFVDVKKIYDVDISIETEMSSYEFYVSSNKTVRTTTDYTKQYWELFFFKNMIINRFDRINQNTISFDEIEWLMGELC